MMYAWIKPLLFKLEPERAHQIALKILKYSYQLGLSRFYPKTLSRPKKIFGLAFKNPIGLSAGFDRNGEYIEPISALGFGFLEIGTVVPKPQTGNPKPRLFRLIDEEALINRIGFASYGLEYVSRQLKRSKFKGVLGINIGKNADTPNEKALDDYLLGFKTLAPYASYIAINLSSPNTQGLRDLLKKDTLISLLHGLKQEQVQLARDQKKYTPLVVKISPDLTEAQLADLTKILIDEKIDGVISANTTIARTGVLNTILAKEAGGLSGRPLHPHHTELIRYLRANLGENFPIIASGGIMDEQTAQATLRAGADLLQIYTGMIYQGPGLVHRLANIC